MNFCTCASADQPASEHGSAQKRGLRDLGVAFVRIHDVRIGARLAFVAAVMLLFGVGSSAGLDRVVVLGLANGSLFRLDSRSLRPLRDPEARVGGHAFGWSFGPGASTIVLGTQNVPELRFVDLARMRVLGDVSLARRGVVAATAWPVANRVFALVQSPGCCLGAATAFVVDAHARRIVSLPPLRGSLVAVARSRTGLVMLLGPQRSVGPTRLAVLDLSGRLRVARLDAIRSGTSAVASYERPGSEQLPGLALDPAGRAFVVAAHGPIAEVNLRSLRVVYHRTRALSTRADIPAAGSTRVARWLPGGRLAVTGWDSAYRGGRYTETPVGLSLVDVRNWVVRRIDPEARSVVVAAAALIPLASPARNRRGLTVLRLDGGKHWTLLRRTVVAEVAIVGGHAFARARFKQSAFAIDLQRGLVRATTIFPRAEIVTPAAPPQWPP
jgi:hypothetical protein